MVPPVVLLTPFARRAYAATGGWTSTLPNAVDWDEFLASGSEAPIEWPRDIDETNAMGLCYTSGTTGNPKGVAFSQRSTYLHTMVG